MSHHHDKHEGQEELAHNAMAPKLGGVCRHWKGGFYEIVAVGCTEATGEPFVAYKSLERGYVWMRTLENFLEIAPDGSPRFVKVGTHVAEP